jgi:hypothetical protein
MGELRYTAQVAPQQPLKVAGKLHIDRLVKAVKRSQTFNCLRGCLGAGNGSQRVNRHDQRNEKGHHHDPHQGNQQGDQAT